MACFFVSVRQMGLPHNFAPTFCRMRKISKREIRESLRILGSASISQMKTKKSELKLELLCFGAANGT